jgi:hypothetical protein
MTHTTPELTLGHAFQYLETSIPAGVTISEYRRARPGRATRWERLKHLAASSTASSASEAI